MFALYDDQEELLQRVNIDLAKYGEVCVQSPTGSGKSIIISALANRAAGKGRTVLVLSETIKIFEQLIVDCNATPIHGNTTGLRIREGKVYITMAQTLIKRPAVIEQFKALGRGCILVPDECHIGTLTGCIEALKGCYLAGFTATPIYKFAKHLPRLYKSLVCGLQVDELIRLKRLCHYDHIARTTASLSELQKQNGEYTEKSQKKAFGTKKVYDGLFEDLRTVPFKKCVIFVASIEQCEETYLKLVEEGFKACRYHSKMEGGAYELAKFTTLDEANICVSVASLTKGWDYKPIDLVVLYRKTTSTVLYLQMIGRGSRIIKGLKEHFRVLDYGENFIEHGYYYEDRNWPELWKEEKKKVRDNEKLGVMNTTLCKNPDCGAMIPASSRACPYCQQMVERLEGELQQGELVNVTASYAALVGKLISQLTPAELAEYSRLKKKQQLAARVARAQDQKAPGWLKSYQEAAGYKPSWVDWQLKNIVEGEIVEFNDYILT